MSQDGPVRLVGGTLLVGVCKKLPGGTAGNASSKGCPGGLQCARGTALWS